MVIINDVAKRDLHDELATLSHRTKVCVMGSFGWCLVISMYGAKVDSLSRDLSPCELEIEKQCRPTFGI